MPLKILSALALATGSTPSTPGTGYGSIFASGSSIFFINSNGTVKDLTTGTTIYRYYTSNNTWTKPANVTAIQVIAVSGGGGGGSGAVNTGGTNRFGGVGGTGGSIAKAYFMASQLTNDTYTITIGSGGVGGAGTTGITGSNGYNGADTTFVSGSTILVKAVFGFGGISGSSVAASGKAQSWQTQIPIGGMHNLTAGQGATNNGSTTYITVAGLQSGGSGGGYSSGNAILNPGPVRYYTTAGSLINRFPNTSIGQSGIDGLDNQVALTPVPIDPFNEPSILYGYGFSGLGSPAGDNTTPSANGGAGGKYGSGGGGSGGAITGASSGNGGRGADGILIIIEYY